MPEESPPPFLPPVLRPPGPGFVDWLLILIDASFTLAGAWLLISGRGPAAALATMTFFGLCLAVAIWQVREKLGYRKFAETRGVSVAGGRRIPMRKGRFAALAGAFVLVGGTGVLAAGSIGTTYGVLCALVGVFGLLLLILLALGVACGDWLAFEPEGLRLGRRGWSFLVHWDNVAHLAPAELSGNPVLAFTVADAPRLLATVAPVTKRERLARVLRTNAAWMGCDLYVMPFHYGVDLATLSKAVEGYVRDPAARRQLEERKGLPGG